MGDDARRYFINNLNKINGILAIMVTDRDGVPLLRVHTEKGAEIQMLPHYTSTFATAADQANKLGLGKNKSIILFHSYYTVVQMAKMPLIVTFIGTENCNAGHIIALYKEIDQYLEELKPAVNES